MTTNDPNSVFVLPLLLLAFLLIAAATALLLRLSCSAVRRMSKPQCPPTQGAAPERTVEFETKNTGPYAPPTTYEQSVRSDNSSLGVPMPTYGRAVAITFFLEIIAVAELFFVGELVGRGPNKDFAMLSVPLIVSALVAGFAFASQIVAWILPTNFRLAAGVTLTFLGLNLAVAVAIAILAAISCATHG